MHRICADILHSAIDAQWLVHVHMSFSISAAPPDITARPTGGGGSPEYPLLLRQLALVSRGNLLAAQGHMRAAHEAFSEVQRAVLDRSDRGALAVFAQPPDLHPLTAASCGGGGSDLQAAATAARRDGEGHSAWDGMDMLTVHRPCAQAVPPAPAAAAASAPAADRGGWHISPAGATSTAPVASTECCEVSLRNPAPRGASQAAHTSRPPPPAAPPVWPAPPCGGPCGVLRRGTTQLPR